jgi:hypothetical protein
MIESMACGTPVIAFRHGSVPEIIEDGVSRFIVENEMEALARIACVHNWTVAACAGLSSAGSPPDVWPRNTSITMNG